MSSRFHKSLAALIPACAALAAPAAAAATTKTVYAGPPQSSVKAIARSLGVTKSFENTYNPDVNAFFTTRVTINASDTVSFVNTGFHTIDIPAKGGGDLLFILPGSLVTGVNDAAGKPFWFNGQVPSLGANPAVAAPSGPSTYDGSTRVESGLPSGGPTSPPPPFKVKFSKPGTYKYFCDVHPGMVGYVVVKAKGKKVPSARQDAVALRSQIVADLLTAKRLANRNPGRNRVDLGSPGPNGVELYQMFPSKLRVKTGTIVKFVMPGGTREVHTATFGPRRYLNGLAKQFQGGPTFPAEGIYPSDPPQAISLSPTSHGNGFAGTGGLDRDSDTPLPVSRKIKFTRAGTYHFICLIHPQMKGTVIVK